MLSKNCFVRDFRGVLIVLGLGKRGGNIRVLRVQKKNPHERAIIRKTYEYTYIDPC